MTTPEYTDANRESLAKVVVDNMDFSDLIQMAYDRQIETYADDKRIFEQDWEYMGRRNVHIPIDSSGLHHDD
jgi:hypothetical protein